MLLLGWISDKFIDSKLYFALGIITASILFFFNLGYAAKLLFSIFKRSRAWKILDLCIAMIIWGMAFSLRSS